MKTVTKFIYPALAGLALARFAVSPTARAVNPAPDGGYANGNTAEGANALFFLDIGTDNTAIGFHALFSNTTGGDSTANGFGALHNNNGVKNTLMICHLTSRPKQRWFLETIVIERPILSC